MSIFKLGVLIVDCFYLMVLFWFILKFSRSSGFCFFNELEFVTSFSDISVGVFKVSNLLESKLNLLKDDDNIISMINTIDPIKADSFKLVPHA